MKRILDRKKVEERINLSAQGVLDPSEFQYVCSKRDTWQLGNFLSKDIDFVEYKDENGRTILHWLCLEVWVEGLKIFFSKAADFDVNVADANGSNSHFYFY